MPASENLFFELRTLAHLGKESIIGKTVRVRKPALVAIGDYCIVDDFTYISCGLTLGRFTHVGANSVIIGGKAQVTVGNFVNIAPGCRLIAASNDFSGGGLVGPTIPVEYVDEAICADIRIADHVLLGTGTVILPGVSIPEGVSTGAMTVITPRTPLKPWTLYVGAPARALRPRDGRRILAQAQRVMADPAYGGRP